MITLNDMVDRLAKIPNKKARYKKILSADTTAIFFVASGGY
jgi:translation initiation factor IF-1